MDRSRLIKQSLQTWAPNWPRKVQLFQRWADNSSEAAEQLLRAEETEGNEPYISTYSMPRGHTKEGHIPCIDTLFIDLDFEKGDYKAEGDRDAWRRDLSHLLVRVRKVARELSADDGWRASLSGHKGVHLFLDIPPLPPDLGTYPEYVHGISNYADLLVEQLSERTGITDIDTYVDVDSSDLGRVTRVPNTKHGGAVQSLGGPRFCVPITIDELAEIDVDGYIEMTSEPRPVEQSERKPNETVGQIIRQHIVQADPSRRQRGGTANYIDYSRIDEYKEQSNDDIELEDIEFLTSDRPCVWEFYKRQDKYRHSTQSHTMELFCICELVDKNVPIDVIKEFLSNAPEYDEEYAEDRIKTVIAYDYKRNRLEKVKKDAPEFFTEGDKKQLNQWN